MPGSKSRHGRATRPGRIHQQLVRPQQPPFWNRMSDPGELPDLPQTPFFFFSSSFKSHQPPNLRPAFNIRGVYPFYVYAWSLHTTYPQQIITGIFTCCVTGLNKTCVQSYTATRKIRYSCSAATQNVPRQNENESTFQGVLGTREPEPQQGSPRTELLLPSELTTADLTSNQPLLSTSLQFGLPIHILTPHHAFPEGC